MKLILKFHIFPEIRVKRQEIFYQENKSQLFSWRRSGMLFLLKKEEKNVKTKGEDSHHTQ